MRDDRDVSGIGIDLGNRYASIRVLCHPPVMQLHARAVVVNPLVAWVEARWLPCDRTRGHAHREFINFLVTLDRAG